MKLLLFSMCPCMHGAELACVCKWISCTGSFRWSLSASHPLVSLTSPSLQSGFEDRETSWPWHITITLTLHQTDLPNLPMLPINFTWAVWGQMMFKVTVVLAQELFCWASGTRRQRFHIIMTRSLTNASSLKCPSRVGYGALTRGEKMFYQ